MGALATTTDIAEFVKHAAREEGFDLAGVAPVRDFSELEYFPEWIEEGRHGEMEYLARRDEQGNLKRGSLERSAPWARSVVVCAMNYNSEQPYSNELTGDDARRHGWISRYAWSVRDYHDTLLSALRSLESRLKAAAGKDLRTWCYVDTGPMVERICAKYAGIGWIGKNTCIINQEIGSWLFLGVILTSIEMTPDLPPPDRCGTCTRCLEVCPTNAFIGPYMLDASRCISYLTIEKRGSIPEDLRAGIGRNVFGCDLCQDVCPWNNQKGQTAPATAKPEFQARPGFVNPELVWLATISEEDFRESFRGSPIKRAKRSGLRRNAVVAIGNSGDAGLVPLLDQLALDADEVVAEHARWALQRLRGAAETDVSKVL
jgi:epoxyqueuosine reductase